MAPSAERQTGWAGRLLVALTFPGARTIRLKLTLLYGAVFLVTGAVLLTIGYLLVHHNLGTRPDFRAEARKLGLSPPPGVRLGQFGSRHGSLGAYDRRLIAATLRQAQADELHRLLLEYIGALALMTAISVAAGWLLAGRALAPLRRITATARRVSAENLGERIGLTGPADELKELADTFDGMLARLDRTFASQRHFVANASHELRTPLAIMRTEIDVALSDPSTKPAELRAMAEAVRDTIDRSEALIEALLMLARSQAVTGREERVDLGVLAADCVTDLRRAADDVGIEVRTELGAAIVSGEPALLERMVANLIDNGIRHNLPGGELSIAASTTGAGTRAMALLVVAGSGAVIDADVAASLTEPFRRLDWSAKGFGLGLSIVRSVAEAHGGSVEVLPRPNGGLQVRVMLPADPSMSSVGVPRRWRVLTQS